MTNKGKNNFNELKVPDGFQTLSECQNSIKNLGRNIGLADMTSPFLTTNRISSMRALLDLLENYNNQLTIMEAEDKLKEEK